MAATTTRALRTRTAPAVEIDELVAEDRTACALELDELLTEDEFAKIARTTVATVRAWRQHGDRGPVWVRPGKAPLYRRSDVQAWIAGLATPVAA